MNGSFSRAEITAAAKAMREENLRAGRTTTEWGRNPQKDAEDRQLAKTAIETAYKTRKGLK